MRDASKIRAAAATTFSVVIPTYNRRAHLMACLASVFTQRRPPDEIIVVDDGSTDGTLDAIVGLENLVVIAQPNAGPGAARNVGATAARGDYLVFLDSDDLWFPWTLQVIAALVDRHEHPSLLSGRLVDFIDAAELDAITSADEMRAEAFDCYLASAARDYFVGAGMMAVRRADFERVGGFFEHRSNCEDHDLALKLGDARGFVRVEMPATLGRRIHAENATMDAARTAEGVTRLITAEKRGAYPGGARFRAARRRLIAMHARPAVLASARSGHIRHAWRLYRETLRWHIRERRIAFLALVPPLLASRGWRSISDRARPSRPPGT